MKYKKFLSIVLGCLLILETPFSSQAASMSSAYSQESTGDFSLSEKADSSKELFQSEGLRFQEGDSQPETADTEKTGSAILPDEGQEPEAAAIDLEEGQEKDSIEEGYAVPEISLNYSSYTLQVGSRLQLTSEAGEDADLTWTSDQEEIATVDEKGNVTAHKVGDVCITATLTVSTAAGIETSMASCLITVEDAVSLNKDTLTLYLGQSKALKASAASGDAILWESSDPGIATVDEKGEIMPIKAGVTEITAAANGAAASCKVVVKAPVLNLKSKATVYLNSTLTLKASAAPKGEVKWKSSNPKVAKVDSKGKVKPVKTGKVTITATCNGLKKQCKVTVKKSSIKLNTKSAVLFEENKCKLKASATPLEELEWISSNTKIAKVDKNGTIVGLKAGKAKIIAVVPGAKATCEVEVISNNYQLNRRSQKLMKGKSAVLYLKNISDQDTVSFTLTDAASGVAKISSSGNQCKITAKKAGQVTLKASYQVLVNGQWVKGESDCAIEVIDSGIVQQQASVAVKAKKSLTLKNIEKEGLAVERMEWVSSDSKVVQVSNKGVLTGKKEGSAKVTATVSYSDGTTEEYLTNVMVSNPKAASSATVVSLGKSQKVKMEGLNAYSAVEWEIADKSLASIDENGMVTAGGAAGKTDVLIEADGKTIKHRLIITNPQLKTAQAMLATGKTQKFPIKGASSKSKITYKSKNESIATVSKSGVIKGRASGKTKIVAKVDGVSLVFQVNVVSKRALAACKRGLSIINSSRYSQARRMSKGYYDCSALVFRAYGCDAPLLGGMPSWAPTAATMAAHLEKTGKVISYGGMDVSKLLPGDLIFYSSGRNGRYRNIYHVSMYYGDGYRLEKPLRAYSRSGNIAMIARPLQ